MKNVYETERERTIFANGALSERLDIVAHLRQWAKDNRDAFPDQSVVAENFALSFSLDHHHAKKEGRAK